MKIAVIPARGGSKRIPRKNIKEFFGRPMISWAISAALGAKLFDEVVVSTDDEEIASIANNSGAKTPFMRPSELADDLTPTVPVIAHAISEYARNGVTVEYACCIYPCSPFIESEDLVAGFNLMREFGSDFVYPVSEYPHPVQRAMRQLKNGKMEFLQSEFELTRTQDLEKTYHDCGQFYWGVGQAWLDNKKMHTDGLGMILPSWRFVDIDSEDDWKRAEDIYRSRNHSGDSSLA